MRVKETVPVLFRTWRRMPDFGERGGGVVAVLPTEPGDGQGRRVLGFTLREGYVGADLGGVMDRTQSASSSEYAGVLRAMIRAGWDLRVVRGVPPGAGGELRAKSSSRASRGVEAHGGGGGAKTRPHLPHSPPTGASPTASVAAPRGRVGEEEWRPSSTLTIGDRICRVFRTDPDRLFTANEVQAAASRDGLGEVGPDSVRVNLMRLTREGFLSRPHYGRYRWAAGKRPEAPPARAGLPLARAASHPAHPVQTQAEVAQRPGRIPRDRTACSPAAPPTDLRFGSNEEWRVWARGRWDAEHPGEAPPPGLMTNEEFSASHRKFWAPVKVVEAPVVDVAPPAGAGGRIADAGGKKTKRQLRVEAPKGSWAAGWR